ncbi:pyruvate kinase [Enteropsectra breve]|nr:pyruvate kinase [Enteropsectra breve]
MVERGMGIARLNFSHGAYAEHAALASHVKEARAHFKRYVGIAMDTKGPDFRIFLEQSINVVKGDSLRVLVGDEKHDEKYDEFSNDLVEAHSETVMYTIRSNLPNTEGAKKGIHVFVDDMKFEAKITEVGKGYFIMVATGSYHMVSNKRLAIRSPTGMHSCLCAHDISDILYGLSIGVDIIMLSFVESADYVASVRKLVKSTSVQIVSKIETWQGYVNAASIAHASDGVMVARGDLCINVGVNRLFSVQKELVAACRSKPLIMATEMMLSMVKARQPTRAEISDIGNAVLDGCDGVMLSSETAIGEHPARCVEIMRKICIDAEELRRKKIGIIEPKRVVVCENNYELARGYLIRKRCEIIYKPDENK